MSAALRDPVDKAIEVLRRIIDEPGGTWGVRELARSLGRPPSTVYRALARLQVQGLVAFDESTERYSLGLEMYRLAAKVAGGFSLREAAMPTLLALRDGFNETAFLGLLEPGRREMMMVATVESTHELRYVVTTNEWRPLYRGASGVAILAFLGEQGLEAVLRDVHRSPVGRDGTVTEQHVRDLVDGTRRTGYAKTVGERVPDAVGIAAPIFDPRGGVIGSVGVTMPSARFGAEREPEFASAVIDAAQRVTRELIY